MQTLCQTCQHVRVIVTPKQSRFLMCLLTQTDSRWPKYPPQPVRNCTGYQQQPFTDASDCINNS